MPNLLVIALLITALAAPPALFWLLKSRAALNSLAAAAIAIVVGWALNVAWAYASEAGAAGAPSPESGDNLSIALYFGWACPAVLVLVAWLLWRYTSRRAR